MKVIFRKYESITIFVLIVIIVFGLFSRFYNIVDDNFVYFDEGKYLNTNRWFVSWIDQNISSLGVVKLLKSLRVLVYLGLATEKPLWYFFSDLRVFFLGEKAWFFPKLLSAIFGSLTVALVYLFSKKYYKCRWTAILAVAILAVYPSHVYYSRLALQETASAFFFLSGMYFYFFPRKFHFNTFLSGFFFACTYLTNYRMIIVPVFPALCELYLALQNRRMPNFRKFIWNILTCFTVIICLAALKDGIHFKYIYAWVFMQIRWVSTNFNILKFLSYPYYIFKLEGIEIGVLFFLNFLLLFLKRTDIFLISFIAFFQMLLFSFPYEQALRYLCIIMPFIAMSVARFIIFLFQQSHLERYKPVFFIFVYLMFIGQILRINKILHFSTDHNKAIIEILTDDQEAKILTTVPSITGLLVKKGHFEKVPRTFYGFAQLYNQGYRYLIVDPQIYVDHTFSGYRFDPNLIHYLQRIRKGIEPYRIFPHMEQALLERFVFDHTMDLKDSLSFLRLSQKNHWGELYVYSMDEIMKMERMF